MNIQTNIQTMNTVNQQMIHRDKTNIFMDKLKKRFLIDQFAGTPNLGGGGDKIMPLPSEATRGHAYSTRNRSIQHPAMQANNIMEALNMGMPNRR